MDIIDWLLELFEKFITSLQNEAFRDVFLTILSSAVNLYGWATFFSDHKSMNRTIQENQKLIIALETKYDDSVTKFHEMLTEKDKYYNKLLKEKDQEIANLKKKKGFFRNLRK